ncbi:MAG TPA: histidinol dehydrogenase [Alteromonas sp.]|jgi:histidinol dehydrogenase|nr:histidinol dehydrogenase [Alteromonas sp.]HCB08920.1 histidinol dehydrogenase [Alteromonas sp.]HCL12857.1 histidinol dehydrogenase [Alteromonas sp.]HCV16504.1 histidinol dehydrogenase [Alteromonas sp.]|tara:strand:- start:4148 stop:5452 length:1305 start_codon:yes stop_codon:yes gene_type:complete
MINWSTLTSAQQIEALARPAMADSAKLRATVADILAQVSARGDEAVLEFTRRFDSPKLTSLKLSIEKRDELAARVTPEVQDAIQTAFANVKQFHEAQYPQDIRLTTTPGVVCEQRFTALGAVGLYIPGGSAPLPSTVMMLGVPAMVAGCERKVLCTPPNAEQEIAPEIAFAAKCCGIGEIYLCGGAQAIAAMAFGTDIITKVDKIFGPGNSFVTEAKQQVSQRADGAAIDMPAGPSEVLVLADESADADFVASDLLSQAEHGPDSQAILVTDSAELIEAVKAAVANQLAALSRNSIASKAMENARYILTGSVNEAIAVSNQYAPEHLIVQCDNSRGLLPLIKHAGSIFLGPWSPESAGDYASGTNHVLPTYGYARNYSSLGLLDFMRRYTIQELSEDGMRNLGPAIMQLADAEGLDAHRNAVGYRLDKLNKQND